MTSTIIRPTEESLRYHPAEIAIPEGFSLEDMDWTAITWVLQNGEFHPRFIQVILAPGALLLRMDHVNTGTWRKRSTNPHPGIYKTFRQEPDDNLMDAAKLHTEVALDGGYEQKMSPVLFTVDPSDYPLWPTKHVIPTAHPTGAESPVRTLGDALALNSHLPLRDVVNASIKVVKPYLKAS